MVERFQKRSEENPTLFNRNSVQFAQRDLFRMIDELSETNPEQAESLLRGSGLENFARTGETIAYDPTVLTQQGVMYHNMPRISNDEQGGYMLQGGGRMKTRQETALEVRSALESISGDLGTDFVRNAFSALSTGSGSNLLDTVGFEKENDTFTTEEQSMITTIVEQMNANNLINQENMQKLINSIESDTGRSVFDWAGASEEDKAQQRALLSTMNQLLQSLNSN